MELLKGNLYFITDEFFERVGDPYLKINYETSMRPHYFAVRDKKTALYWMVPCSTRIEKFERILAKKRAQNKPTDTIKIVRIQGHPTALLFQDMFPISPKYIEKRYFRGGDPVFIDSERLVKELERNAYRVIGLIRRGIKFTPTQPDALRIEKLMLAELEE